MYQKLTKTKNLLTLALLLCFYVAFTNKAMAQTWDISDYSSSGNSVSATLTVATGTLTISGTGNMADFDVSATGIPWNNYLTQIKTVTINSGVTNIGNIAFQDCNNLQTITIPSTVIIIGMRSFYNCTNPNLQITIPKEVVTIEAEAFRNCSGTFTIESGDNTLNFTYGDYSVGFLFGDWFKDSHIQTLYLGRNYTYDPFMGMSYLQTITIGNKVTFIGSQTFSGCTKVTNIKIEDSSTPLSLPQGSFYWSTFNDCPIQTLYLGRDLTPNDSPVSPFTEITSLSNLTIGNQVTNIGRNYFNGCNGLKEVTIPSSVTEIGYGAFYGCSLLATLIIGNNVKTIGDNSFRNCTSLKSLIIPKSVSFIGENTFIGCLQLVNVRIEDSSTPLSLPQGSFYWSTFNDCPIQTLYLGRDLTPNDSPASPFIEITSLSNLTIGNQVTNIGRNYFNGCNGLKEVTIPSSVTEIGYGAFYGCNGLTEIHSQNSTPPNATDGCFYNVYATCKLYVPTGAENAYKTAIEWEKFFTIIPTGINDVVANQLLLYPNPSQDNIFIKSNLQIKKVEIYSLTGVLYISENNVNEKISVSDLATGIYFLRAHTDKGLVISKFLKE